MKRIIKVIKAYWFIDLLGNLLIPLWIIVGGLFSVGICSQTLNYINKGITIDFRDLVLHILYITFISYGFIFNTHRVNNFKRKVNLNMNDFLIQAPVLKKDIYNAKFIIFQILSIPPFVVVLYFIRLNIFVSKGELISAYSGFFVLFYCICTMTLTIAIGFSSLFSKKYRVFWNLFPILLYAVFVIYLSNIPYAAGTLVNNQNMFNDLGPRFIPILKACRYIGGTSGLIVIFLSTLVSYLLGCRLPLKISEKVGN